MKKGKGLNTMFHIQDHIEIKPTVCHGSPVIKGTRMPVSLIVSAMAGGDSIGEILEDYPKIRPPTSCPSE